MYKLTGILFLFLAMVLNTSSAKAAVTDCHPGCEIALQDDGVHFYNKLTGTEEGIVSNVGTGNGVASAGSNGYVFVTRQNSGGVVWIIDTKTGSKCSVNTGATGSKAINFGNYAYFTAAGNQVAKVALDCSTSVLIPVGTNPYGITKDSTTLYILNMDDGTISTIVPPAETSTTYPIGRSGGDFLVDIQYRSSNNKIYMSGFAGIYEVDLPLTLGTSVLWQALPNWSFDVDMNSTYLATSSPTGGEAYLIPFAAPATYDSIPCSSCRSADLSDDTLFTTGGNVPDVGIKAWTLAGVAKPFSPLTTTNTDSSAYLPPFTPPAPVCQNGIMEGTEECDQSDFGSSNCGSEGFDGGSLSCSGSCTIVNTACTYTCGNNDAAPTEECDGTDHKSQTCSSLGMGFTGGTLACNPGSCTFDTSGCTLPASCNDGNVDAGEDCDGANLDNATCATEGFHTGTLACTAGCAFDYTGCNNCGNNTADTGEQCDGADLNSQNCIDQGFSGGTLGCSASCTFDTSSCVLDSCNNGVIDIGEMCDDGNNLSGDGCSNVCQIENGWECSGTPSTCTQVCGNGTVDTGEECDGSNLDNATCADFGGEGNLTCKSDCTLDTTGCLACNANPQLIYDITVNDVDQTRLAGHNKTLFTDNLASLTEASGDRITCGDYEVGGETVASVVVSLEAGEYKLIRISGTNFTAEYMFFSKTGPAKLYINILNPKKTRIDKTSDGIGLVGNHDGEDMNLQIGDFYLATLGTDPSIQFVTFNPLSGQTGNFIEYYTSTDEVELVQVSNPTNRSGPIGFASFTNGEAKYLNTDAAGDLSEIGRKPTNPPDCNCSTFEPGAAPILMLVLFFMFWSLRRSRRRSLQRVKIKFRNR